MIQADGAAGETSPDMALCAGVQFVAQLSAGGKEDRAHACGIVQDIGSGTFGRLGAVDV
jgi:hypothetical protein